MLVSPYEGGWGLALRIEKEHCSFFLMRAALRIDYECFSLRGGPANPVVDPPPSVLDAANKLTPYPPK